MEIARHHTLLMPGVWSENLQNNRRPSDERTGSTVRGGDDLREAVREVIAIGPSSLHGSPFLVAIGRIADISSGRYAHEKTTVTR
jgi:hypothetical protein